MTYPEINTFGRIRKMQKAGPVSMFRTSLQRKVMEDRKKAAKSKAFGASATPTAAQKEWAKNKTRNFFGRYYRNRHKLTVLTPSYHAENYSPDDNRFDLRPFLYPWPKRQYDTIDRLIKSTPTVE